MNNGLVIPCERKVWLADPFGFSPRQFVVPEGLVVAEIVDYAMTAGGFAPETREMIQVYIGAYEVTRTYWSQVRPKVGTNISLVATPLGSGSGRKIGMTIAAVAIAVLSYGAGSYISSSLLAAGYSSTTAAAGGILAASAVSMVGGLAIQAVFGQSDDSTARYSIDGVGNQVLEKDKPVPVLLGRRRIYPRLAATTWTECNDIDHHGNNYVYVNLLLFWTVGQCGYTDLKIGETLITEYDDYEIQDHLSPTAAMPTIYDRVVREDVISAELRRSFGWVQRRTRTKTTQIGITLSWPAGLYSKNYKGSFGVELQMQYRAVGDATWISVPAGDSFTVRHKTKEPFYKTYKWEVASGQYDVRVRRTNSDDWDLDSDDQGLRQTTAYWLRMHSYGDGAPITNPKNYSFSAFRIRATNQVNGTLDKLNAVVTSVVPRWDGTKFDDSNYVPSRNPGELFHWYATSNVTAVPQNGATDDVALGAWADQCTANKWYCDTAVESGSVEDVLNTLAVAGQGFGAVWEDGLLSVAVDDEKSSPCQVFSARNVHNFRGEIMFPDEIHAVNVVFDDETSNYQSQTRTIYATGYDAKSATLFETVECRHCTTPDGAYIYGWRYLASRTLRPEIYTFDTWTEGLVVRYGKRVDFAHWRVSVGIQGTRIRSLSLNADGNVSALTLDDDVTMEATKRYVLKIQRGSSTGTFEIATVSGTGNTLLLKDPVAPAGFAVVGNHVVFGIAGAETLSAIVAGIEVHKDKTTTLTCIPYAPDLLKNGGTIPVWDPVITSRQTTKAGGTRALSPDDMNAINDTYLAAVLANQSQTAGDVELQAAVTEEINNALSDTTSSGYAELEGLVSLVTEINANTYDQYQRVSDQLFASSSQASASIEQVRAVAVSATSALAQEVDTLSASLSGKADGTAVTALTTRVSSAEGAITSLGQQYTNLSSAVDGKASGTAVAELSTEVSSNGEGITALSNSLTQVTSTVGNLSAGGYSRIWTVGSTDGVSSTIGLAAVASKSDTGTTAALLLHSEVSGSTVSSWAAVRAGAFYVQDANGNNKAVFNEDGTLTVGSIISRGTLTDVAQINASFANGTVLTSDTMATIPSASGGVALTDGTTYVLLERDSECDSVNNVGSVVSLDVQFYLTNITSGTGFTITLEVGVYHPGTVQYPDSGHWVWTNLATQNSFFLSTQKNKLTMITIGGYVQPTYTKYRVCMVANSSSAYALQVHGYRITANF